MPQDRFPLATCTVEGRGLSPEMSFHAFLLQGCDPGRPTHGKGSFSYLVLPTPGLRTMLPMHLLMDCYCRMHMGGKIDAI